MKRYKIFGVLVVAIMLVATVIYSVPVHFNIFRDGNIRTNLEIYYGKDYPYITKYYYKDVLGLDIVISDYSERLDFNPTKVFRLNDNVSNLDYVKDVVSRLSSIPYTNGQNNPNSYKDGLDCQGYSILINRILDSKGIDNKIVYTSDHMYNTAKVDGSNYVIDLAKHKFCKI